MTILAVAALTFAADEPKSVTKDAPPPAGWSIATDGSGIPAGQDASEYVVGVDREVARGGKASMSMRSVPAKPAAFRAVTQFVKADACRGKRVRLAGYLKTRDVAEWCGLFLRVDGPSGMLGFDNMEWRKLKGTTDWSRYEAVLDVPKAASRLAFGPVIKGAGQVWADDLTLELVDPKEVQVTKPPVGTTFAERPSNLEFDDASGDAANPVPGWKIFANGAESYSQRIAQGGAHGGRAYLEIKSMQQPKPLTYLAHQDIAAGPYQGKRVRFQAYLKAEGVADEAYVSLQSFSEQLANKLASGRGRGSKGTADWQAQEVVLDVPDDADQLCLSVMLRGPGVIGIDDARVEVVDPSKVPVTTDSEVGRTAKEKRDRELAEAYAGLPDRPVNLDFEL